MGRKHQKRTKLKGIPQSVSKDEVFKMGPKNAKLNLKGWMAFSL